MIASPVFLSSLLIAIVVAILFLEKQPALSRIFHYLPAPFWCYFIPMLLATLGLLPEKSPVYVFLTTYLLAGSLILLLLPVRISAILRLGPTALGALLVGSLSIGVGCVLAYVLLCHHLPPEMWKSIGALSASWTGGSANMLAVKEALQTPEAVFAPMVVVDTLITYLWMGIMIALSRYQAQWDQFVKADLSLLDQASKHLDTPAHTSSDAPAWHALWMLPLMVGTGMLLIQLAGAIPWTGILSASGWAFVLASALGIALSFTPASRLERYGASRWGYFCLYLLLAGIGAKAHLTDVLHTPMALLVGVIMVMTHAALLFLYGWWRKLPLFYIAAASQANIGGTASAPVVAGIYQPVLAPVGLLLAIAANVYGTYLGLFIAHACRWACLR